MLNYLSQLQVVTLYFSWKCSVQNDIHFIYSYHWHRTEYHTKSPKAVTRNTDFIGAVVTLELRSEQQQYQQQLCTTFLRKSKMYTRNGTRFFFLQINWNNFYEPTNPTKKQ
jgi:hypothetical protein